MVINFITFMVDFYYFYGGYYIYGWLLLHLWLIITFKGVKDVSMQDIDIAHRVPARKASSRPNPIICKFVRRQVKESLMAARKEVSKVTSIQLGYEHFSRSAVFANRWAWWGVD